MRLMKMILMCLFTMYVTFTYSFSVVITNVLGYIKSGGFTNELVTIDLWILSGGFFMLWLARQYCLTVIMEVKIEAYRDEIIAKCKSFGSGEKDKE